MTKREELAARFMAALEGNHNADYYPEDMAKRAFLLADAFLSACEPKPPSAAVEREPDAVWTLEQQVFGIQVRYPSGTGMQVMPNDMANTYAQLHPLLAGRERVRLRVYVEEVEA